MSRPLTAETVLLRRAAVRLGLQAGLLAAVIVMLLSAAAATVVLASQRQAASTLLDAAVSRADDVVDPPAGVWLIMQDSSGATASTEGLPAGFPDPDGIARAAAGGESPETEDRQIRGVEYRIETLRQGDGTVVQGVLDLTANHTERDQLIVTMLICGGVGLLLAAGAGAWLGHRALRPLSAALALQRRFVADAGHELRTPVTLLNTRAQLLRRRVRGLGAEPVNDATDVLADLDGIVTDSARLAEILEDLLLAADPVAATSREPVDVVAITRGVLEAAGPEAGERGVRLSGPEPGAGPTWVSGSPAALRRAVTALVDNAVRHANHEVTAAVQARNRHVLIEVADDGPGIDPELAPRLFERFVSGAGSTDARRRYGLGLALVSEIAAAHGGRVELLERPGPGAALLIELPAVDPRPGD